MTKKELNLILEQHYNWLNNIKGTEQFCADFYFADLREVSLKGANLRRANLYGADLNFADLHDADLRGADLRDAVLINTDLQGADLRGADLQGADLRGADLNEADLRGADLRQACLTDATLQGANLHKVLTNDTIWVNAILFDAKNIPYIPLACPEFGSFIGYKKASGYIVELEIPEDALRLSATSRKCRCNKARVLSILNRDRTLASVYKVKSDFDHSFIYRVGETVTVDNFNNDRWKEYTTGIHFFINFQDAVNY